MLLTLCYGCTSVVVKTTESSTSDASRIIFASGYSKAKNFPQLTQVQNRFSTEQSAKLNAYRALAKQLYNEKLTDHIRVADQVISDESYRIYIDLFLREAKVIESKIIADQYKTVLALTLTDRFYQCTSATINTVSQCLREDNKTAFTRIGYNPAPLTTVNIACAAFNCANQLHVSGFSKKKNIIDSALLNFGIYDGEWGLNSGLRTAFRYFIATNFIFN